MCLRWRDIRQRWGATGERSKIIASGWLDSEFRSHISLATASPARSTIDFEYPTASRPGAPISLPLNNKVFWRRMSLLRTPSMRWTFLFAVWFALIHRAQGPGFVM
ncbi:hypothetical protein FRC14_007761 [Serendipita sp. 396]|nr:hypothetical protein FRC14_007761 [Serendipita sp. 396]KAG8803314.1 hypothetical protein FRC18_007327 [Serendipita sp. 400]KAG8822933.1 hypothetical protein FRC19_004956 [Serendipita sp. 401]KAG8852444.1 hypothetical protein FRB91_006465 [Serendipita sp. 411]KAG9055325.1 hypothetical protein FS842_002505 [Serendipita sp. 407]